MTSTRERKRVVLPKDWSFDLADELIDAIKGEFEPHETVEKLAPSVAGKPIDEAERIAKAYFADYGRRWMDRTIELGEKHTDRTFEVLKAAAAKTGELTFPFIPERFIEIAYLSTQPIYSLPIVENGHRAFSFKMVFCDTIGALREQCGDELAGRLPCSEGCLAATRRAFEAHGLAVDVTQDASLATGEFCQFTAVRRV